MDRITSVVFNITPRKTPVFKTLVKLRIFAVKMKSGLGIVKCCAVAIRTKGVPRACLAI